MNLSRSPVLRKWKLYMSLLIPAFYNYSVIGLHKPYLREYFVYRLLQSDLQYLAVQPIMKYNTGSI